MNSILWTSYCFVTIKITMTVIMAVSMTVIMNITIIMIMTITMIVTIIVTITVIMIVTMTCESVTMTRSMLIVWVIISFRDCD